MIPKDESKTRDKIKKSLQENCTSSMKYSDGDHQILPYTPEKSEARKLHIEKLRRKSLLDESE